MNETYRESQHGIDRRGFLRIGALAAASVSTQLAAQTQPIEHSRQRMKDVNTTDIAAAIRLACQTMGNVFNEQDRDIPYFASWVTPQAGLAFNRDHSEAHVPGRHLNALLHAEDAVGIAIDPQVIDKHSNAAFFSFSGPLSLPLNRNRIEDPQPSRFLPHNLREGLHALYALVHYRDSARAREIAQRCIATIDQLWDPSHGWDSEKIHAAGVELVEWPGSFITGVARAIGPLAKYHAATGYGPALELALKLKDKATAEYFTADGTYDLDRFGTHTHSTTCTMSSLAYLAEHTRDAELMDRVQAFFENGLRAISDDIGWSIENTAPPSAPDRGEANNTGDILETALALGRWGYPQYFQFAERCLRCHLLPSQLRDISFIEDPPAFEGDLPPSQRHLGAFGFPAPYGHAPVEGPREISFNMDIVGGATDSLCYAYENTTRSADGLHRVDLLFDAQNDAVEVTSPYPEGRLTITLKQAGELFVRMPSWVDQRQVSVSVDGRPQQGTFHGQHLVLTQLGNDALVRIDIPLVESEIVLKHRTRDIRARLKGDSIVAMESFGADLAYFDEYTP